MICASVFFRVPDKASGVNISPLGFSDPKDLLMAHATRTIALSTKGALKLCRKGVFGITVSDKNSKTKGLPHEV